MADSKNADPRSETQKRLSASPVAAVTRATFSTEDAAKEQRKQTRLLRHQQKLRKPEDFKDDEHEQEVFVQVNNGGHSGYRAIGLFFPNGNTKVSVTDEELAELKAESDGRAQGALRG